MEKLTKIIVDCSTGVQSEVELTAQEIADREAMSTQALEEQAQRQVEADAKEALRQSAISKLVAGQPLTEEEASLLVVQ
jgi:hypothetical protein